MGKIIYYSLILLLLPTSGMAYPALYGWHWYNEQIIEKAPKNNSERPLIKEFSKLRATDQLKILQMVTKNLKAKAILSGDVGDIATYKQAQDFWVSKASQFAIGWEKMLLLHPAMDYSLRFSNENSMASITQRSKHDREGKAVDTLSKKNGLILFYRGKEKGDVLFSTIISRYSKHHKFALIPVSVDNVLSPIFSNSRQSEGLEKAKILGIHYFPALVLVNTKTQQHQVVSYGFKSETELSDRLLKISDGWRAEF